MSVKPDFVPLYRYPDGRTISRVLTVKGLVELHKPDAGADDWPPTALQPPDEAVFVVTGLDPEIPWAHEPGIHAGARSGKDAEIFYFPDGELDRIVFLGTFSETLLVNIPRMDHLRAALWPFAEDLLLPHDVMPEDIFLTFRAPVYLDDAVYARAKATEPTDFDTLAQIFDGYPVRQRYSSDFEELLAFDVNFGRQRLIGYLAPVGWRLNWENGPGISHGMPTLWEALMAAQATVNRPQLRKVSVEAPDNARIGMVDGEPLIDPELLEPYWMLDAPSPLLWSGDRFWAWYRQVVR